MFPCKQVADTFDQLPNIRTVAQKSALIKNLFEPMSAGEVKYAIKIMTGDLRIGLKESLVEEAIAKAFDRPLDAVRRANMLTGDIGETLRSAAADQLDAVRMRLFHPVGFMLATPVETADDILTRWLRAQCWWKKNTMAYAPKFIKAPRSQGFFPHPR